MEEKANDSVGILEKAQMFFAQSPEYIYLIVSVVCLVMFVGIVKDKNWAVSPNSGKQRMFYQTHGRKAFRIIVGAIFFVGFLGSLFGFFVYKFNVL